MLKNNKERKEWIENDDNYEVYEISPFSRWRRSRKLADGSYIVIYEVKEKINRYDFENRCNYEYVKWGVIGKFITSDHNNETILEKTSTSDIVARMAKMK